MQLILRIVLLFSIATILNACANSANTPGIHDYAPQNSQSQQVEEQQAKLQQATTF